MKDDSLFNTYDICTLQNINVLRHNFQYGFFDQCITIIIVMKKLLFPVELTFKIGTLANDFVAHDATGSTVAYVRQKMFKLKEDIEIFSDESRTRLVFRIQADQWLDWSTAYNFTNALGRGIGKVARKGWASLWKAHYDIIDQNDQLQYHIREENAWVKVIDGAIGDIPVLSFFTGYLFNPSYIVTDTNDNPIAKLTKEPSFWGRRFTIHQLGDIDTDDDDRIMLSLMMMILLERRRG